MKGKGMMNKGGGGGPYGKGFGGGGGNMWNNQNNMMNNGGMMGGGGQGQGMMGGGGSSTSSSCTEFPCAAPNLGDVGTTDVAGDASYITSETSATIPAGENIYGAFEAGFSSQQNGDA